MDNGYGDVGLFPIESKIDREFNSPFDEGEMDEEKDEDVTDDNSTRFFVSLMTFLFLLALGLVVAAVVYFSK